MFNHNLFDCTAILNNYCDKNYDEIIPEFKYFMLSLVFKGKNLKY